MRAGAAAGHDGYFHEGFVYGSDAELLGVVVPHLREAVAAGEPAFASLEEREAELVRDAMVDTSEVTFLPPLVHDRPPTVIERMSSVLTDLVARGAEQVRVVSTVPHPGLGAPWDGWCRYEAAVNDLFADLPVWGLCLYDHRVTPAYVLRDAEHIHPRTATADGRHLPNPRYRDPRSFLRSVPERPPDPFEARPPTVELVDPVPAGARRAVRDVARRTGLGDEEIDQLVVATSEAVTNAVVHGQPPVTLRAWVARQRVVVTVTDGGDGPDDPYAGLVPRRTAIDGGGGYGLWIVHRLVDVTFSRSRDWFTIRLVAGEALPSADHDHG